MKDYGLGELAESMFQATGHGLESELLDRNCRRVPARRLVAQALSETAAAAVKLRCEAELEAVAGIVATGSGAEIQRRVHAAGGIDGLLAFLVEETARAGISDT